MVLTMTKEVSAVIQTFCNHKNLHSVPPYLAIKQPETVGHFSEVLWPKMMN